MDGFLVTAALFGIVSVGAVAVIVRAIIGFIREGREAKNGQVATSQPKATVSGGQQLKAPAVTKSVAMPAPQKPAAAAAKPGTTQAPTPQQAQPAAPQAAPSTVSAPAQEAAPSEPAPEPKAPEAIAAEPAVSATTEVVTAVEGEAGSCEVEDEKPHAGAADARNTPESMYPPVKAQGPNGESEKRISEIQDIIKKYV